MNLCSQGQILTAVTGPSVFVGSFYIRPITLDLRLEYLIYGQDVQVVSVNYI